MMNQLDAGRRFAEQVTALGCRLALDDFGTGFASLSYLKQIPAQLLKIDIEFVRDLTQSETDERLVRGIIGIAREFDQTPSPRASRIRRRWSACASSACTSDRGTCSDAPNRCPTRPLQPAPAPRRTDHPARNRSAFVRRAFAAFAARPERCMVQLCHPDVVLRPHSLITTGLTGRQTPYRGHDGLRSPTPCDVTTVWKTLDA